MTKMVRNRDRKDANHCGLGRKRCSVLKREINPVTKKGKVTVVSLWANVEVSRTR